MHSHDITPTKRNQAKREISFNPAVLLTLRARRGISQHALAIISDVPQSVISALELGKKKDPAYSTVTRLADALGVLADAFRYGNLKRNWEDTCRSTEITKG